MEQYIKDNSTQIVENTISEILAESHVDVKFDDFKKLTWAFVMFNDYENDKEYSIKLLNNNEYVLVVGYYDADDEYFEFMQKLTPDEIELIPAGLKKVMLKVVEKEEGLRVPSKLLIA